MLIDTHCHIYLEEFDHDRAEMLSRAEEQGVTAFLMPAIDTTTHRQLIDTEGKWQGKVYAMMGLHPCSVKENYVEELRVVETFLASRKFIAIGETGLDYYWDKQFIKAQQAALHRQVDWALQYDLPVVLHTREAMDDCIAIMQERQDGRLRGVFHCFSGTAIQAQQIIDLGFMLGIGGVLTFKNAGLDKIAEQLPLENMILETDAPYLAPVPYRGKRNECSYLINVATRLAEIKKESLAVISEKTTANAKNLFGL